MGRVGRSSCFGSKSAASIVLYNEEDLKDNAPGMTDNMRKLLRSLTCLKIQLASYFGYEYSTQLGWCCSGIDCLKISQDEEEARLDNRGDTGVGCEEDWELLRNDVPEKVGEEETQLREGSGLTAH